MRPVRLDLAGFTVFRDETTVDFTDADFFTLVGPTGAGKSTVLDAICFALYGTVPRWGDRRAIVNALAPSANEARVRLVFESAGLRYVASRVVRRDGKGRVSTSHAGLELLPPGFDLSRLDSGLSAEDLGEVLAGTPAEMDAAIQQAVGLPYEQFTSCVVLPQGEFAQFLHAKPAVRQQILVNLLGLSVYERIRDAATAFAGRADAQLAATDPLLSKYADATDEAVAAAAAHLTQTQALAVDVAALLPQLTAAQTAAAAARSALAALDAEVDRLRAVRPPLDLATIADAVATARFAATDAAATVRDAEEREEKLRGELAGAGEQTMLQRLLDGYAEQARLLSEAATVDQALAGADTELSAAHAARDAAMRLADKATAAVVAAEEAEHAALTADRAASLRPHLAVGEPCPVCTQTVAELPEAPHSPALAAARAAVTAAKTKRQKAVEAVGPHDRMIRDLETALARARGHRDNLAATLAKAEAWLANAPGEEAVRQELEAVTAQQKQLAEAGTAVQAARSRQRRAATAVDRAEQQQALVWRKFDTARDGVAPLGPPPADRTDAAGSWAALADWATDGIRTRVEARGPAATAVDGADEAVTVVRQRIGARFAAASVPLGASADPNAAAAVAVSQGQQRLEHLTTRRDELAALHEQRAGYERDSQQGKALALHLRANNFERWLLAEALDALVDGASRTLQELSGGQYDLVHDNGEFWVIDHHDAGLRRAVRTLSGGETFQASLALALALSEQLSGMSTGSATLESIILDEGFGTLDATTLDTVAATLENLASRGDRMVGVVTHVAALAERIPVRFEVGKDSRTATIVRIDP